LFGGSLNTSKPILLFIFYSMRIWRYTQGSSQNGRRGREEKLNRGKGMLGCLGIKGGARIRKGNRKG